MDAGAAVPARREHAARAAVKAAEKTRRDQGKALPPSGSRRRLVEPQPRSGLPKSLQEGRMGKSRLGYDPAEPLTSAGVQPGENQGS
jgi:hypothetical protein